MTQSSSTPGWILLKDGAAKVAQQRLASTHHLITTAIGQFHEDASTKIEGLHEAKSEPGLGIELFKAVTDALMLAFPEALAAKGLTEIAIKAFRDGMISGIQEQEKATGAHFYEHSKDQLRHVLDDLARAFRASAQRAWSDAHYKVDDALTAFFDANPNYTHLSFDQDATAHENWVSDQIGIRDPAAWNPADAIVSALWAKFTPEFERAKHLLENLEKPGLQRTSYEFEEWMRLDKHHRVETLAGMDEQSRLRMLNSGAFHISGAQIDTYLELAKLWADPATRSAAETELMLL